jgi:hypothetical protein
MTASDAVLLVGAVCRLADLAVICYGVCNPFEAFRLSLACLLNDHTAGRIEHLHASMLAVRTAAVGMLRQGFFSAAFMAGPSEAWQAACLSDWRLTLIAGDSCEVMNFLSCPIRALTD